MKSFFLFLISIFSISLNAQFLQDYSRIWYFGENAGITFNTNPPTPITDGALSNLEGCSSVGNQTRIFFYTNGITIWNRNHQVMPNGSGLLGHTSSAQCGLSVPLPGSFHIFYVFTTDANENSLVNGLRYNIVNMQLDNGYGDVTSVKNKLLAPLVTEKITVVPHANETDYWIIAHEWNSNNFLAYLLTSAGLDTVPVVTSIGYTYLPGTPSSQGHVCGDAVGFIKASPDGKKIATVVHNSKRVEVYDFNRSTGVLSNLVYSSNTFNYPYGLEFSPNSKFLYMSTIYSYPSSKVYQFDLSQPNFFSNGVLLKNSTNKEHSAMVLAPDKKIYVAEYSSSGEKYLSVIENPDYAGTACSFNESVFYLGGKNSTRGLPNMYYYNPYPSSVNCVNSKSDFNVFPNPAEPGEDIMLYGVIYGIVKISIFDTSGRTVYKKNGKCSDNRYRIKLPQLKTGMYIISVEQEESKITKEILVK